MKARGKRPGESNVNFVARMLLDITQNDFLTCKTCNGVVGTFRDELSRREFATTRMCQRCQDSVFEGGDNE